MVNVDTNNKVRNGGDTIVYSGLEESPQCNQQIGADVPQPFP